MAYAPSSAFSSDAPASSPWVVWVGTAVILVQLVAIGVVVEHHAREAAATAATYVTSTLQPPATLATAAQ